ncbi:RNA polymerase sigma factor [Vulgatibacter incomptus]|uniref:RNA polymerase sigma-54 factor RpoN n=1 Tax=Vulgatibacter incomptus TaxID=1391653 RepID=A0A0K1PGG6_9BACT|nr:sigma-70 family RNA polymerase sigma factor [Vulgatibacter incomptus]AKU92511.1 RNA polymerase sigma-54 factor RpoN [Vulgatibacter incomptus]
MSKPSANLAAQAPEVTDDALVTRFQDGQDRLAFDELVRRHRNRVYALALRMMKNEDEALEIVQDTFLQVFRKLPEFRGESLFGSWVHRIAANFALMKLRRKKLVDQFEAPLETETEDGMFSSDGRWEVYPTGMWGRRADDLALDAELREKLVAAVEKLPEAHRAVFMLRDFDGLSYNEIADALETSVPAVKSRLHRARLALREDLALYFEGREA